jgi:hypothetical protein
LTLRLRQVRVIALIVAIAGGLVLLIPGIGTRHTFFAVSGALVVAYAVAQLLSLQMQQRNAHLARVLVWASAVLALAFAAVVIAGIFGHFLYRY